MLLLLNLLNIIPQKRKPQIDGLFLNVLHIWGQEKVHLSENQFTIVLLLEWPVYYAPRPAKGRAPPQAVNGEAGRGHSIFFTNSWFAHTRSEKKKKKKKNTFELNSGYYG